MNIFGQLFGGEGVPEWARFLKREEFKEFLGLVRAELERLELDYDLDPQEGVIALRDEESETRTLGLLNLAQMCRQSSRTRWATIIAGHFGKMMRIPEQQSELDRLGADFETARPVLKVRIFADDIPLAQADAMVFRRLAEGILAVLVYDLPDSVASVHPDHATNWGRHGDELFQIALENVKGQDEVEVSQVDLGEATATLLTGNSFFIASHALCLEDYLPDETRLGALVALPHRHVVLIHPIRDKSVLPAINNLLMVAHGMHAEGPGSISPNLYWWRDGRFTLLPAEVGAQKIEFQPPEEFLPVLSELLETDEQADVASNQDPTNP